jgi:hypothetical protein
MRYLSLLRIHAFPFRQNDENVQATAWRPWRIGQIWFQGMDRGKFLEDPENPAKSILAAYRAEMEELSKKPVAIGNK